jgi:hypothetical protein
MTIINKMKWLAGVVALAGISPSYAETLKLDMEPGLWEYKMALLGDDAQKMAASQTNQIKQAMEEIKKQMANMPAEQRKQMEAVMAQSGMTLNEDGIGFQNGEVSLSDKGSVVKSCVTQAEIERGQFNETQGECASTIKQLSAKHFKSTQSCKGGDGSSEMEVIFDSPKHYTAKGTVTHVVDGKQQVMQVSMVGTWLGNDCGTVKPNN